MFLVVDIDETRFGRVEYTKVDLVFSVTIVILGDTVFGHCEALLYDCFVVVFLDTELFSSGVIEVY